MIKAVFFDFYKTQPSHAPPREVIYGSTCHELGIEVEAKALFNSLPAADMYYRDENSRSPIDNRSEEEKIDFYVQYASRILAGAGVQLSHDAALQLLAKLRQFDWKMKAYDDTLPALEELRRRGLILGLISNVAQDMESTYEEMGLNSYLAFKVTSSEVGCDKPQPEIFQAALKKAEVKPEEAIHVGDQYDLDIVGARGVGMKGVLVDRNDFFRDITDCPRIHSLTEIVQYVQSSQD